ncbi:hypothetical protein COY28_01975, partial [Candidatus Woesearchaeota archaeon CG_4_10_14_0_2_um_filter_57_5]
ELFNGGLLTHDDNWTLPRYALRTEIRMGDYDEGGGVSYCRDQLARRRNGHSWERDLRSALETSYYDCVEDFERRNVHALSRRGSRRKERYTFFSHEQQIMHQDQETLLDPAQVPVDELETVTEQLHTGKVYSVMLSLQVSQENRYLANTEGTRAFTSSNVWTLSLLIGMPDDDGFLHTDFVSYHGRNLEDVPSPQRLRRDGLKLIRNLASLANAPWHVSNAQYALMDHHTTGTLFHEAFMHAVEANRLSEGAWGEQSNIFFGRMGSRVMPEGISIIDDPTRLDLIGGYTLDEDGVAGKRVQLVTDGMLTEYLHSRQTANHLRHRTATQGRSNGHARAESSSPPIPRQSNLRVSASNGLTRQCLLEELLRRVEGDGQDYGLLLENARAGQVDVEEEGLHMVWPSRAYRIYPDGRKEPVKGAYLAGTPHMTLQSIIAMGHAAKTHGAFCGAESGWVPITVSAPAAIAKAEIARMSTSEFVELPPPLW